MDTGELSTARRRQWFAVAFGAALALSGPAAAGAFRINPVQINLPADRRATVLTITNVDSLPVSIRVQALSWAQVDGADVYSPTTNVIASPPIVTIGPGKTQLVRVGLLQRPASGAYRIIVEEIPRNSPAPGQVQVALRFNLPLYVLAPGRGQARIGWRAWSDGSGELIVEGTNTGSLHGQFSEIGATSAGKAPIVARQMGVVLPGSSRRWSLGRHPDLAPGSALALTVRGPAGKSEADVVLERR